MVVGRDPAGDPEHPAVETGGADPHPVEAGDGAGHRLARRILSMGVADPTAQIGDQARIEAPVEEFPSIGIAAPRCPHDRIVVQLSVHRTPGVAHPMLCVTNSSSSESTSQAP